MYANKDCGRAEDNKAMEFQKKINCHSEKSVALSQCKYIPFFSLQKISIQKTDQQTLQN